jgi:hypothetical protein
MYVCICVRVRPWSIQRYTRYTPHTGIECTHVLICTRCTTRTCTMPHTHICACDTQVCWYACVIKHTCMNVSHRCTCIMHTCMHAYAHKYVCILHTCKHISRTLFVGIEYTCIHVSHTDIYACITRTHTHTYICNMRTICMHVYHPQAQTHTTHTCMHLSHARTHVYGVGTFHKRTVRSLPAVTQRSFNSDAMPMISLSAKDAYQSRHCAQVCKSRLNNTVFCYGAMVIVWSLVEAASDNNLWPWMSLQEQIQLTFSKMATYAQHDDERRPNDASLLGDAMTRIHEMARTCDSSLVFLAH